ncbi:MAG: Rab family GTPase [Candidatus Hodarchaeota archaeon]
MDEIISGIIYSKYDLLVGPDAVASFPETMPTDIKKVVSLKTLNLLSGDEKVVPKKLEIISFPAINMKGIIKFFQVKDEETRGGFHNVNLTLVFRERFDTIFYKYRDNFNEKFQKMAESITELEMTNSLENNISGLMEEFNSDMSVILKELQDEETKYFETMAFPEPVDDGSTDTKTYRTKIIVIGDPEVGKTSTVLRFTDNAFKATYLMTMGVNISMKRVAVKDKQGNSRQFDFSIWDVAGQSKFHLMRQNFYSGAKGLLLVFSLVDRDSFDNIIQWHEDVRLCEGDDITALLLGNKADLVNKRKVSQEEIDKLSKTLNLEYMEVSALTGRNINEAFQKLAENILATKETNR